jgi:serine/threonine protein kinase
MAVVTTVDSFLDVIRKSKVLESECLTAFVERLSQLDSAPEKPEQVAQLLYQEGLLSYFQAKQLLQGRWRRFIIGKKYKLVEMIGQGGMGAVYLCEHIALRRAVALKVMPEEKVKAPGALERFQREARAIAQLYHPNIVRAHDLGEDNGVHFMVMEYIDGVNLERLITRHYAGLGLPVERACQYIADTALALQHAHVNGWVHRDIKPANILVDRQGIIKLLDLGLSRMFEDDTEHLTQKFDQGNVLGTADYIAPEQALNVSAADIRSDLYGLGCTFYFLLAGRPPFHQGNVTQKLIWHQHKYPERLRHTRVDLPEEIERIVFKMIDKRPENRFQEPIDLYEALKPWCGRSIFPPAEAELPAPSPLVKELLPTAHSKSISHTRRTPSPAPYRQFSSSDAIRLPPREPSAVDTLKNRVSSAPTKTDERIPLPRQVDQKTLYLAMVATALTVLLVMTFVVWLMM